MNPELRFLRAHLNTEREPLLLGPAPIRVEVEWSIQQTINSIIDTWQQALRLFEELSDYAAPSDYFLAVSEARIRCLVEIAAWGVPERPAQWLVEQLPDFVILRFAEMIQR